MHATSTQVHQPLRPQPQLTLNEHHRPYAHSRSSPYYTLTTSAPHSTQLALTTTCIALCLAQHSCPSTPTVQFQSIILGTTTKWSAEEQRDVAADVVQAIVEGVDILILAKAWQRDQDDDEAGLHDKPSEGKG